MNFGWFQTFTVQVLDQLIEILSILGIMCAGFFLSRGQLNSAYTRTTELMIPFTHTFDTNILSNHPFNLLL